MHSGVSVGHKLVLNFSTLALLIVLCACGSGPEAAPLRESSAPVVAAAPSSAPSPTPREAPSPKAQPSPSPSTLAAQPAPAAPPPPAAQNTCGAPANPWGYNFCGGNLIYSPPSNLCSVFNCIPNFWRSTAGYVDQCNDGTYSHSGGRQGACSYHGGEKRPLYSP
jgi:hypothetical protein